ncbi:UNVERIFIED_CONTAM: hypothetical protein Slati_1738700 [Sesamum latifolium]|uniref:Uncharacterized protein n=1 Tax=Sesamum latifolium TaxID=2727402 RepID=A0AAW2WXE2_9LAMI
MLAQPFYLTPYVIHLSSRDPRFSFLAFLLLTRAYLRTFCFMAFFRLPPTASSCSLSISLSLNNCLLRASLTIGVAVLRSCCANTFLPASFMSLYNSLLVICITGSVCLDGPSSLLGVSPSIST